MAIRLSQMRASSEQQGQWQHMGTDMWHSAARGVCIGQVGAVCEHGVATVARRRMLQHSCRQFTSASAPLAVSVTVVSCAAARCPLGVILWAPIGLLRCPHMTLSGVLCAFLSIFYWCWSLAGAVRTVVYMYMAIPSPCLGAHLHGCATVWLAWIVCEGGDSTA